MNSWQRWRQAQARRAGRRQDKREEHGRTPQWFLLTGAASAEARLAPQPEQLRPLYPTEPAFWADPFVWQRDGKHWIFFEDYPFSTRRGRISVLPVDASGLPTGPAQAVLEEPCHLSYPFLFEHEGELYMMPEKTALNRVDLYRCVAFPARWELATTLMDGIKMADATLFEHEGRWWLFGAAKQGGIRINESLFAFYADSPLSTAWTPHAANPLVRDFSRGRPAGRIFRDGEGRLIRPSQDCVRRYGHGLQLSRIEELCPQRYREQAFLHLSSAAVPGWRGLHHLDWQAGLMVMDAQRLLPAEAAP